MDSSTIATRSSPMSPIEEGALPPRPSTVCEACWRGPFAVHFVLWCKNASGSHYVWRQECCTYSYVTSMPKLEQGAAVGCVWCIALRSDILSVPSGIPESSSSDRLGGRYAVLLGAGRPLRSRPGVAFPRRPSWGNLGSGEFKIKLIGHCGEASHPPFDTQALSVELNGVRIPRLGGPDYVIAKTTPEDPAAAYITTRNPTPDVGSLRALSLAKSLIEKCVGGHEKCTHVSPSSDTRLPSRLIDCTDPEHVRLAPTRGQYGKYLALSYVWGEAQPHRTIRANLAAYESDGIDAVLLPQTIRDAIYVTHTLGFQYLWADSLCIIQDSDEDKLHELGRMHLVYRHAYITIIAASATRVSDGFLQERRSKPCDLTLPFICPRRSPGEPHLVGTVHLYGPDSRPAPTDPTTTRAWCLQESLMSPRTLVFTSRTLQFNCHTALQDIGGAYHPRDSPTQTGGQHWQLPDELFHPDALPAGHNSPTWEKLHDAWWETVTNYTQRALTAPSDKLVACGAVAEAFGCSLDSQYLAGLWRHTLLPDLMWKAYREPVRRPSVFRPPPPVRPALSRSPIYRAPSWSWASVDGKVEGLRHKQHSIAIAEVVSCRAELKDPEVRFGEVTSGSLVLRTALLSCRPTLFTEIDDQADEETAERGDTRHLPLLQCLGVVHGLIVARVRVDRSPTHSRRVFRRIGIFAYSGAGDWLQEVPHVEVELV